jgi:hypothetical protein
MDDVINGQADGDDQADERGDVNRYVPNSHLAEEQQVDGDNAEEYACEATRDANHAERKGGGYY